MRTMWMLALIACGGGELDGFGTPPPTDTRPTIDEDWGSVSFIEEGVYCFDQNETRLQVTVTPAICPDDDCVRDVRGSCGLDLMSDAELVVTSELAWEQDFAADCDGGDCETFAVRCSTGTPPDGSYTVTVGQVSQVLDLPVKGLEVCLTFPPAGTTE